MLWLLKLLNKICNNKQKKMMKQKRYKITNL